MRKNEVIYDGELTGTLSEQKEKVDSLRRKLKKDDTEFGQEFDPIQQMWRINPVDEVDYKGTIGYKDS